MSFARDLRIGLPEALRALGPMRRIGVVGLAQVMKVEDYLALRDAFPSAEIVDASDAFERLRAHKAPEEIEGVRESVAIADACFDRLLEIARIGITEREIGAAMYERCYALGGEDPLFLSMYPESTGTAAREGRFGPPVDRVLERGEQLVFSFELVGPHGLLDGVRAHGRVRRADRAAAAHERRRDRGARRPAPGRCGRASGRTRSRRAITSAVAAHGADCSYWSGHGIGQDVIEEPWLGLEIVQDRDRPLDLGARRGHGAREPSLRRRPRRAGRRLHGRHVPRHARGRQGVLAEAARRSTWSQ